MAEPTIEAQVPSIETIEHRLITDEWLRRFVAGVIWDYLHYVTSEPGVLEEMHAVLLRRLHEDGPIMNQ